MEGASFCYKKTVLLFLAFFLQNSGGVELELTPASEQVKTSGGNIVITCAINDEAESVEAVLKWYNPNGEEIKKDSRENTNIRTSSTSSKLYLKKLSAEDAGTYTCNTTVNGKSLEKIINLRIFKKHSLLNCSDYQQPVINTNAKIRCTASGDPAPDVQWRHKGVVIETGGRYAREPNGLVIHNITEADNGVYEIESEITVRSDFIVANIVVSVTIPPIITQPPVMSDPIKGTHFTMTCKAEGKPNPTYSWMKDKMKINDPRFIIDEEGGSLEINAVQEADSGSYICVASNVGGDTTAKAKVTVLIPPTLKPLANQEATEAKRVQLVCIGEGVPPPSLTWQKGSDAPFANGAQASDSRVVIAETAGESETKLKLTISSLKAEDASNYTCTATNTAGTVSNKVQLRVNYRPQIVNTDTVAYNWMNNKRNISCSAKGRPKPVLSWQTKQGKIEANDDTYRIFGEEGYELSTSFLQVHVSLSNEQTVFTDYQCVAINKLGRDNINVTLKQAVVPRAPNKVSHVDLTPTTITLVISVPTNNGGIEVDQYRIEYGTGGVYNHTDKFVSGEDKSEFTKVVLKRLAPETKYQVKVFAGNAVGLSTKSYDLSVTTLKIRNPYDVFINSDRLATSPTSYTVTWHEPRTGGAIISSYSVQYRVVSILDKEPWQTDPDKESGKFIAHTVKGKTSAVLHNLLPNTYYEVQVVANNIIGPSEPRAVIILTKESPLAVVTVPQQKETSVKEQSKVDLTKQPQKATEAAISEGGIVGVIIALLIIVLIVIDLGCYMKMDKGVTKFVLENVCKRGAAGKDKSTDVEAGASQETNLLEEKEKKDGEANGEENKEPASDEGVTDEKNEDKDELMKDHTDEIEPDQKKDEDIMSQEPVKA